jgi:pimeloyl-ACP methyl ester carboxylesterase
VTVENAVLIRGYVEAPSGQIHYRELGTGFPLVFLHQTATTGRVYEPAMRLLADRYRCIAIDTPGFGNSDSPPTQYTMSDYAKAIHAAVTSLGAARYHLLGHHTGSSIAIEIAYLFPDAVDHLVLHSCPEGTEEFRREKLADSVPLNINRSGDHIDFVTKRLLKYRTPWQNDQLHYFITEYLTAAPHYHEAHLAVWDHHAIERAPTVRAKTLLLSGEFDDFVKEHEDIAAKMPEARTEVLQGMSRLCMIEDPERYTKVAGDFLAS